MSVSKEQEKADRAAAAQAVRDKLHELKDPGWWQRATRDDVRRVLEVIRAADFISFPGHFPADHLWVKLNRGAQRTHGVSAIAYAYEQAPDRGRPAPVNEGQGIPGAQPSSAGRERDPRVVESTNSARQRLSDRIKADSKPEVPRNRRTPASRPAERGQGR